MGIRFELYHFKNKEELCVWLWLFTFICTDSFSHVHQWLLMLSIEFYELHKCLVMVVGISILDDDGVFLYCLFDNPSPLQASCCDVRLIFHY